MTCISVGTQKYFDAKKCKQDYINVSLPVNLRYNHPNKVEEIDLCNKFSMMLLKMGLYSTRKEAMIHIKRMTTAAKKSFEYYANYIFLQAGVFFAPEPLVKASGNDLSQNMSLVLSNVPGPKTPILFNGKKSIKTFFFLVPAGRAGFAISFYSHNGIVKMAITSDEARIKDPQEYMDYVIKEINDGIKED